MPEIRVQDNYAMLYHILTLPTEYASFGGVVTE